ncbi:HlyD family efflux transporter periplasmic adaptor subunit [Aneurinibacillus sp. Ricciae_BoGa-3]|uniref:HlyD family secretion protein n=1 Tax=Aneurinibacillus sp. Ricciae_BoGa-3 TaxID=3022697 RepID=UPI00233F87A9|nr:HlyD family efflux transporter periplasmic adaptor subunit [Aneurinibacillus sp. Ricciae_BoGa-3]WCK52672.1 HlyD family efflux transporter periplasmic adaptor subunit [Aneurinibacillus sp. Ricciae_BoGa-3]
MNRTRIFLVNLIMFLAIIALGFAGYYYYFTKSNYIGTDDAKVTGDIVSIASPAAGKLTNWKATEGSSVDQDATVGQVSAGSQNTNITSPISGTVIQNKAASGQLVAPGQPLAQVVDLKKLYVEANIEETNIKDVKVGQDVDVTLDADTGTKVTGKVEEIGHAANSVFSLLPQSNASGDYTKVTQKVPVKISLDNLPGGIVPGMNATVSIHK